MHAVSQPLLVLAGLRGLCPRCGSAGLFRGLVSFAPRCRSCGLDLASFNVGDGPAAFLIFIVGAIVVGLAMFVELKFSPPFWVHVLLWVPVATGLVILLLRASKTILATLEYRHRAREGRLQEKE
jgi:uncharacterized protein (DUF983 family)